MIHEQLDRNGLILRAPFGEEGFLVVQEAASDLILSAIAENISRRTGLDAITDKPIPFALNGLNNLGVTGPITGGAEGALLTSLVSVLIPAEVALLDVKRYRDLRESYVSIRGAFKELTADLARINRLDRIQDPKALSDEVRAASQDFTRQYLDFRKSTYARNFKRWAPLYVGGLLAVAGTLVSPPLAAGMAGVSLVVELIQKEVESRSGQAGPERVFNMLAGLRKDIITQSGIEQMI